MFTNYLKTALRILWKNRGFSAINIAGLSLGMACSLLITLWVLDERSVDGFHANTKNLYRIVERQYFDGKIVGQYYSPGLLARQLKRDIPEVAMASSFEDIDEHTFAVGDKIVKQKGGAADSDYFRMFSYPLLAGRAVNALSAPQSIAISRSMASIFFGAPQQAMGKTLRFDNCKDFQVSAVFQDLPSHVSQKFDFLLNWNFFLADNDYLQAWDNNDPKTNILLHPGTSAAQVDRKILHFLDKFIEKEDGLIPGWRTDLFLQPFSDVYLHSHFTDGAPDGGRIEYVHLFSLVALFILIIACINFMNLTTARAIKRGKEIGVRKVIGAERNLLIRQFMGEAMLFALMSVCVALLVVVLTLPAFNQLTSKQMALPFNQWNFWIFLTGLVLVAGALSGSYPALVLSSFNPIRVLKGGIANAGPGALWFRKGLVVFQFNLSIMLIISTLLISRQVRYVQGVNLGYDRENLLYIPIEGDLATKADLFKQEALHLPGISMISQVSQPPTQVNNGTIGVQWPGKDPNSKPMFAQLAVGYDFIETMKARMVQGREFSKDFATDSVAYILNQAAVKKMAFKNPLGHELTLWGHKGMIIGVTNDFHFQSLHDPVRPIILRLQDKDKFGVLLVRTLPGQTTQALGSLERLCKDLNPKFPFTYQFSSEEYSKLYKSEELVGRLSVIFAILAIFISCLGLLGLSIFTAIQRTKEIGIRKVLGANTFSLFQLLSTEFLILVGLAFLIATPLAWMAMNQWLQHFAYQTQIRWWIFALSGILAVLIALGTVCFQTIKIARVNPAKSLKSE
jgi:putative ABC transport system permease protein